jgi:hypothetical protein
MKYCHMAIWLDITPLTSWFTKMADKATTRIAGQLLQALVMHQSTTITQAGLPNTVTHYVGSHNLLAGTASPIHFDTSTMAVQKDTHCNLTPIF